MAAAATAITPLLPSAQGGNSILALTYIPLLIFSGGFGSSYGQPHWLNTEMSYFPVRPVVDTATKALQHSGAISGRDVLVLVAWMVACLAPSVRFFRWDPTRPAHAGRTRRTYPSSFVGNLWVSHRPAACGQRGEQRGGLGLPDGELSDSDRQAG
ncbi:MAG TPA: ABC transporter permease [Streptosporangiaceae bacterium]